MSIHEHTSRSPAGSAPIPGLARSSQRLGLWLTLLSGLSVPALGCGKQETPAKPAAAPTAPAPATNAPDPAKEPTPAPKVDDKAEAKPPEVKPAEVKVEPEAVAPSTQTKLLEPGAEPKVTLRVKPAAASTQATQLTMTVDANMSLAGQAVPMKFPPFKMGLTTTVDEVRPNGDAAFTLKVDSADIGEASDVMPPVMKALKGTIGKVVGMGGKSLIDERGVVKEARFDTPADAPNEMKQVIDSFQQALSQMAIPFPSEPVGVGAKWQATMVLSLMGLKVDQVATYEIVAIDGGVVKLKFTTQLTAPPQDMHPAQVPANVATRLTALSGGGSAEATYDLTRVLPTSTTGKSSMALSMSVDQRGQKIDMDLKMNVDMTLESK